MYAAREQREEELERVDVRPDRDAHERADRDERDEQRAKHEFAQLHIFHWIFLSFRIASVMIRLNELIVNL